MRKFRELNTCIASLQAIQGGNDLRPEQQQEIKRAMEHMRQLKRFPHPTQSEVFCAVSEITDALLRAFLRK